MRYNFDSISGGVLAGFVLLWLISIGLWIWALVWATQKKGWIGFLAVFVANFWGWLIIFLIVNNDEKSKGKNNTHRERERRNFGAGFVILNIEMICLVQKQLKKAKFAVDA